LFIPTTSLNLTVMFCLKRWLLVFSNNPESPPLPPAP
jgi:hypothetical protein